MFHNSPLPILRMAFPNDWQHFQYHQPSDSNLLKMSMLAVISNWKSMFPHEYTKQRTEFLIELMFICKRENVGQTQAHTITWFAPKISNHPFVQLQIDRRRIVYCYGREWTMKPYVWLAWLPFGTSINYNGTEPGIECFTDDVLFIRISTSR